MPPRPTCSSNFPCSSYPLAQPESLGMTVLTAVVAVVAALLFALMLAS